MDMIDVRKKKFSIISINVSDMPIYIFTRVYVFSANIYFIIWQHTVIP